jgi:glycyl-tRNA synthetase beta chain
MTAAKNLLVELHVEELPPKTLKNLGEAFTNTIFSSLKKTQLVLDAGITSTKAFASPRRLAVFIPNVLSNAADRLISQKLMPAAIGLDAEGKPSLALLKKLSSLGADASVVSKLKRVMDGKAEALYYDSVLKGATLAEGLQIALDEAIAKLPIAKVMTYQLADGWKSVQFVRPAHGLVALHGTEVVPISTLGLTAGRATQGHRFESKVNPLVLKEADSYEAQLEKEGAVIPDFERRRDEILKQITDAAAREKLTPVGDDDLLNEVTALVERPNVLVGTFEKEFLEMPQECLILTMKANQKYFPLLDANGKLTNKFLIVSNIRPADPSLIIGGNERVVRPRLADAKFFFDKDRKQPLDSRVLGLAKVVYHSKLGSQGERVQRVQAIARAIGQQLGGDALAAQADQAALLAKADLLTDMVGEFPELQGIMGRYYAQHDGLSSDIAYAIEDHYRPRFAGDELPRNQVGICVALADKLETLVGMFGIGQIPTGDKDPFALRRHALGVIRLMIENNLSLSLKDLLTQAFLVFGNLISNPIGPLSDFIYERLAGLLREQGYSNQEVEAVLSYLPQQLGELHNRLSAVRAFSMLPEADSLAAANKRVRNILEKNIRKETGAYSINKEIDISLLKEPAEIALNQALSVIAPKAEEAFEGRDYETSLKVLATLKAPVDDFFDSVMVNVDDTDLRANRLGLLTKLHRAMNRVADISKLAS